MGKGFENVFEYNVIYVYEVNDEHHKGMLKIGKASLNIGKTPEQLPAGCHELNQAAKSRIKEYTNTLGMPSNPIYTELAVKTIKKDDGTILLQAFSDHDVHRVLENSGYKRHKFEDSTGQEWYKVDLETVKRAISAVKDNRSNLAGVLNDPVIEIQFRPEQKKAISKTLEQFKSKNTMLWNAKMRFGKTLSALKVVKESAFEKTIIITHRPVVDDGWYEDFDKIFREEDGFLYGSRSKGNSVADLIETGKKFIYFASIQDLRGSSMVGGKYNKNDEIFSLDWDFIIVDEAHEGTNTELGVNVRNALEKKDKEHVTKVLELSGTPFNRLDLYEDNIYTWDYVMEQAAKKEWNEMHFGDHNPYEELPEMKIYTYDLGEIINKKQYVDLEDKAFNFREFFRTWTGDIKRDYKQMPTEAHVGDFVHADDVLSFLDLITKSDELSYYPYANDEYRNLFKHSLWMVPGVKEAKALSKMMKAHPVFGSGLFEIVNVAGEGDEEEKSDEALNKVKKAIDDAGNDGYTITLSCGKLTTGVTVREWTAVLMLSGSFSTSAANYLQTIFRVQSPCNKDGKVKTHCYVFDFAPDRTLKMVAEYAALSTKAGKTQETGKRIMGEFLNYCPVVAIDGTMMKSYDTNKLLQQLKRAYAEKAVRNGFDDINLYNDELLKLDEVDWLKFENLKKQVGTSKAEPKTKDIDINAQGFTEEEYKELQNAEKKPKKERTPEEQALIDEAKKKKEQRNTAISILRSVSIRMPLLIYGANIDIDEDFTLEMFLDDDIVDTASWDEFMPNGVTKDMFREFMKYYDSEIFVAAGRKIRNTVVSADRLSPTERVQQIADLFACFKNPDKETVLTPWRVVNMHMRDCLGGYSFYNQENERLDDEPIFIEYNRITKDTLANKQARILEINSKTGLYPLYVVYSIFRAKCKDYKNEEITYELENELWKDTVENNIFVICKTPMAKQITKRTLAGFNDYKVHAHYFNDLINMMKNKPESFVAKVLKESYWKVGNGRMKFDAIVGNPPYQITNQGNGNGSNPVYHLFIDSARAISGLGTFIHPGRCLFNAGKTPKDWNSKILNDEHFKVVDYWADSREIFPSVDVKGGIAISMWDESQKFGKIGTFTIYPELRSIMNKVVQNDFVSFAEMVYPRDLYRLTDELYSENAWAIERPSQGHRYDVGSNVFEIFPELFLENKPSSEYAKIFGRNNNQRIEKWIKRNYLRVPDNFEYYKVFVAKSNGSGALGETLSSPVIGEPFMGHTVTFLSIGKFSTYEEADALLKYIKTKFARVLLGTLKVTQDNPRDTWSNIPMQDFTSESDIDWSKTIADIGQQLYKKYNLSEEEIEFIETKVKSM